MTTARLATALRAHAQGIYSLEAATELLIAQPWLHRTDFTSQFINVTHVDDRAIAVVNWPSAITALGAGDLLCSEGEQRMLRMTASPADGIPSTSTTASQASTITTSNFSSKLCCTHQVNNQHSRLVDHLVQRSLLHHHPRPAHLISPTRPTMSNLPNSEKPV